MIYTRMKYDPNNKRNIDHQDYINESYDSIKTRITYLILKENGLNKSYK